MYEIYFSESALRSLRKLERETQERVVAALERIRITPERFVTKIVGDSAYKLRVGEYRVLVDIDKGDITILVIAIGHRSTIYK